MIACETYIAVGTNWALELLSSLRRLASYSGNVQLANCSVACQSPGSQLTCESLSTNDFLGA